MRGGDIRRDLERALDDLDEAAETLRAEIEGLDPHGSTYSADYFHKVQRITGECYSLRNHVREALG